MGALDHVDHLAEIGELEFGAFRGVVGIRRGHLGFQVHFQAEQILRVELVVIELLRLAVQHGVAQRLGGIAVIHAFEAHIPTVLECARGGHGVGA